MITGGRVIIDEAGIEYNNRDFKDFFQKITVLFTNTIGITSLPSTFSVRALTIWTKRFGRLRKSFYVVKKGLLPWFIHRRQIKKRVGINDMSKEIIDEYYFVPWSTKIIFSPPLWKMFNTISREEYPQKQWKKW